MLASCGRAAAASAALPRCGLVDADRAQAVAPARSPMWRATATRPARRRVVGLGRRELLAVDGGVERGDRLRGAGRERADRVREHGRVGRAVAGAGGADERLGEHVVQAEAGGVDHVAGEQGAEGERLAVGLVAAPAGGDQPRGLVGGERRDRVGHDRARALDGVAERVERARGELGAGCEAASAGSKTTTAGRTRGVASSTPVAWRWPEVISAPESGGGDGHRAHARARRRARVAP